MKKRRGHKKAIIAIARMLLTAIYNMLKKNESYNPEFYCKADRPPVIVRFLLKRPSTSSNDKDIW